MGIPYDPRYDSIPDYLFAEEIDIDKIDDSILCEKDIIEEYTRKMREEFK